MRTLTQAEYSLLDEVARTGDCAGYRDPNDDAGWALFETLEDRDLVGWAHGPISRNIDESRRECGPFDGDDGETDNDPVVTPLGKTAMMCYRAMRYGT